MRAFECVFATELFLVPVCVISAEVEMKKKRERKFSAYMGEVERVVECRSDERERAFMVR